MNRFSEHRLTALNYWVDSTKRIIIDNYSTKASDDLVDTFECKWQNQSTKGHVSIFCSLGDWASNITDILKDKSSDKCHFENEDESQRIYRYFTRLLLVVSEILTDFEDMYIASLDLNPYDKKDKKKARNFLFSVKKGEEEPLSQIFEFINNVCKHKSQHIHKCNHHLKVHFADNTDTIKLNLKNYIHTENLDFSPPKSGVIMPKLLKILYTVFLCYKNINEHFDSDKAAFERICDLYTERAI